MNTISKLLTALALVLLAGCAVYQPYTPAPAYSSGYEPASCTWQPSHQTTAGESVEASWHCPVTVSSAGAASDCSWVTGYIRKDGVSVAGHYRCARNVASTAATHSGYTGSYRPITGGPVRVKGYYRKDGTYVRSHTRKRSRR